jgi:hypothetical protein
MGLRALIWWRGTGDIRWGAADAAHLIFAAWFNLSDPGADVLAQRYQGLVVR